MKILIISQYFWPEEFRVNDLALSLIEKGHEVSVLTGLPNYPKGIFFEGYKFKFSIEYYKKIKIYRVPIVSRGNSSFRLFLNYISFLISGIVFSLLHRKKYDSIFAVNFSPITSVIPAIIFKYLYGTKINLWVQDLWPESVSSTGKINSKIINKILNILVKFIYKSFDKIFIQSRGFVNSIVSKGISDNKIIYLPNWAEDLYLNKEKLDKNKYKSIFSKSFFKIMFAGNIGEAQDFESILKTISNLKENKNIQWIFVGDGSKKEWFANKIDELCLNDNVLLVDRMPVVEMPNLFLHADIMFASLKDEEIFSITIPSKIQSYMASGKPILSMISGETFNIIKDSNCGFFCNSGDFINLQENVLKAFNMSAQELRFRGLNGKKYYLKYFEKTIIIKKLLNYI
jgi:glycosyltransferase involved in cell wall biosynthesis